jgi:hypothetical protein
MKIRLINTLSVFLATCLMHLLPESMEQIEKAEDLIKWNTNFPFAELCISLGFIFVLFVEQVDSNVLFNIIFR